MVTFHSQTIPGAAGSIAHGDVGRREEGRKSQLAQCKPLILSPTQVWCFYISEPRNSGHAGKFHRRKTIKQAHFRGKTKQNKNLHAPVMQFLGHQTPSLSGRRDRERGLLSRWKRCEEMFSLSLNPAVLGEFLCDQGQGLVSINILITTNKCMCSGTLTGE